MSASASSSVARSRPSLVAFFVVATAISGFGFLPMVWASWRGAASVPAAVRPLQLLMLFGPGLLAIAWAAREGGAQGVRDLLRGLVRWRVHPLWYAAVLLGPLALDLFARLVAGALVGSANPLPAPLVALERFAPAFGAYLLLNTEELAWRGYAWPRLRDRLGALRGSLLLGVIWGVLHAPLFLMKGGHPGGWPPALFLVMTVSFSVLFALAYEGTGGSLLIAHLFHQALNAWGDAIPVYPRVTGNVGAASVVVVVSIVVAVIAARRAGWRWRADHSPTTHAVQAVA